MIYRIISSVSQYVRSTILFNIPHILSSEMGTLVILPASEHHCSGEQLVHFTGSNFWFFFSPVRWISIIICILWIPFEIFPVTKANLTLGAQHLHFISSKTWLLNITIVVQQPMWRRIFGKLTQFYDLVFLFSVA